MNLLKYWDESDDISTVANVRREQRSKILGYTNGLIQRQGQRARVSTGWFTPSTVCILTCNYRYFKNVHTLSEQAGSRPSRQGRKRRVKGESNSFSKADCLSEGRITKTAFRVPWSLHPALKLASFQVMRISLNTEFLQAHNSGIFVNCSAPFADSDKIAISSLPPATRRDASGVMLNLNTVASSYAARFAREPNGKRLTIGCCDSRFCNSFSLA